MAIKKESWVVRVTLFVGICLFLHFTARSIIEDERTEDQFQIRADGTVRAGALEFNNLKEYVQSDYFRIMGKRCLIKGRYQRMHILASTSDCTLSQTVIQNEYWPSQASTIPIVFHIIHKTDDTGNISDQRINDQVAVLNEDFRAISDSLGELGYDTKIQFELAGITRTANDNWFNDNDEYGYKQTLGWDQSRYLNVYVNSASGYLGYAYLPQEYAGDVLDGVVVLYESVGGRNNEFDPYDQGRTLVHEVGHYLGLLHTFEGYGCYEGYLAGDLIDDTPSESTAHYGCSPTYTCETPDPIHNYMNYTDDSCMHEFTEEQANRLMCSLVNYRPDLATVGPGQYSLVISATTGGTTDPEPGNYTYDSGTEVIITAIPESEYEFSGWSGDASGTDNPITLTMDSDKSVTANFICQYTLTISSGDGGTTDPEPGSYIYDSGTEVDITAVPDTNYRFTYWTGDIPQGHEEDNPLTITMDSDKSVTANFIRQYTLTISSGDSGTTDPEPGSHIYDSGTEVIITAVPNTHYRFTSWSEDVPQGYEEDNPLTITMDSDKSLAASFIRIIYAPLSFTGQKRLNRSLFLAEYINTLSWGANADNVNIVKYRIYQVTGSQQKKVGESTLRVKSKESLRERRLLKSTKDSILVIELDADTYEYWHRRIDKNETYTYSLVAVNDEGREGEAAYVTVR